MTDTITDYVAEAIENLRFRADNPTGPGTRRVSVDAEPCECDMCDDDVVRLHVTINGRSVFGHWPYNLTWYLVVGAQYGAPEDGGTE